METLTPNEKEPCLRFNKVHIYSGLATVLTQGLRVLLLEDMQQAEFLNIMGLAVFPLALLFGKISH